jgi:histone-lysine N-methyltransferase SETD8
MPRGRRKVRGGLLISVSDRGCSSDSYGAPRTKETRLDSEGSDVVHSPSRSLREKITDYFGYSELDYSAEMPDSPEMPVLIAQVDVENVVAVRSGSDSPPVLSDGEGSEQSCGNSDSGKENDEEERRWRPGKSEVSQTKLPLQESQPGAAGRITRSASGKVPLSLKSCENLQNEFNIADGGASVTTATTANTASSTNNTSNTSNKEIPSPPTPHKIIKMKEPSLCAQSLNKLKSISLTPKKSTKTTKQSKRATPAPAGGSSQAQQPQQPSQTSNSTSKAGKLLEAANASHKVTEYFPIRRSERKPKAEIMKAEMESIVSYLNITDDANHGSIEIAAIENKGRGVKAVKSFSKGDFVVEYSGELIDIGTAKDLETKYSLDASKGCYMYYFKHKGKQYCIDATSESGRYGRLVNHSRITPNCVTKVVMVSEVPRLILVAKHSINPGEELLYDYGDRSKESLKAHPWLAL